MDDLFDRRRYEITNGLAARNPVSDFGRRNVDVATDRRERMFCFQPGAIEDGELDHLRKVGEAMPGREPRDVVFTDQIDEFRVRLAIAQRFHSFDGIGRRGPFQFQRVEAESRLAFDRGAQHFHASVGGRRRLVELVRRNRGGNEKQFVDLQLFDSVTRENQMTVVDWIKRAAEDADLFQ